MDQDKKVDSARTLTLDSSRLQHIVAMIRRLTLGQFAFNRPHEMAVFGQRWFEIANFLESSTAAVVLEPLPDSVAGKHLELSIEQSTRLNDVFVKFGAQQKMTSNKAIRQLLEVREMLGVDDE